jgi:hypothetical protein
MTTRKEIRDWFAQTLSTNTASLGVSYPTRVTHFEEDSPERYTSVYIVDTRYGDELARPTAISSLYIRFHLKMGTDDDLDQMESVADQLIQAAVDIGNPAFSISKESVSYEGSSDDTYDELSIEYEVLYRD